MTTRLVELIPDAEVLLSMAPEELGGVYLQHLRSLPESEQTSLNRHNATLDHEFQDYPPEHHDEIARAIMEAWMWLEREGFLAPKPGQMGNGYFLTRRAMQVQSAEDLKVYGHARLLPHKVLHPRIASKVWAQFTRGEYDVAVFQAFKEVEVAVRDAGGYEATDLGVKLMRKTFHPDSGPLTDQESPVAEREARAALFAGAIGSYKNPHSHRDVPIDEPIECVELLFLASHLLRLVEARRDSRTT